MFFLIALLLLSVTGNIILVWYVRKTIQILSHGIENVEELQGLLNEYASLLEPLANMENYYADPAITSAVANTKLVVDACRVYKTTLIRNYDEEDTEDTGQEEDKKEPRKAQAKINSIKA
jgi:hypothetical protein